MAAYVQTVLDYTKDDFEGAITAQYIISTRVKLWALTTAAEDFRGDHSQTFISEQAALALERDLGYLN